jgi:hypothetical protein
MQKRARKLKHNIQKLIPNKQQDANSLRRVGIFAFSSAPPAADVTAIRQAALFAVWLKIIL